MGSHRKFYDIHCGKCCMRCIVSMQIIIFTICSRGTRGFWILSVLQRYCDPLIIYIFLITLMVTSFIIISRMWLVQIIHTFFAVARNKQVQRGVKKTVIFVCRSFDFILIKPCIWCCVELKKIIDGTYVEQSGLSIREFEFDSIVYDAFNKHAEDTQLSSADNVNSTGTNNTALADAVADSGTQELSEKKQEYRIPPTELFKKYTKPSHEDAHVVQEQETIAALLEQKLERFGIKGEVVSIKKGPVVTLFEYQPHIDSKLSKIIALEDDLALALQALSIRIIAPIPGTAVVGFEVANKIRATVLFSTIVQAHEFMYNTSYLPMIIGVDTVGMPVIADLATMPHLLLAGATGSGKSVALNAMLMSLLCRLKPDTSTTYSYRS